MSNAGRAYLFNALTGALAQTLIASSNSNDYNLGYSIDIEGNTVVAGSPFGGTAWGRVQIFDATTGANTATLTDPSPNTNENFGYSVALSGNKLLVGVPGESSTGPRRGVVQLFDVPNRSFAQTIANPTPDSEDRFGDSVAGLGNLVAVGTTGDPGVNFREGAAYLLRQHSLSASLTSGELILADVGSSSTLTAVRDGDDLVVTEVSELFDANIPAGATLENNGRTLRMPIALFNKLRFNLGSGIDSLTLDLTGGDLIPDNSVVYDGGTNLSTASDSLTIVGGDQGAVTYFSFDANTGSVTLANYGVISYTGIESIRNTGDSTSATFSLPLSTNTTNLGAGGAGLLSFTSTNLPATFPATVLDNPSDTLTINRGTSADTISAGGFSTAPSIVLGTASNPFSAVNFTGAVNFAQDRNLTVYTAGTINFTLPASDLSLIGTGSASLTTARDIWLGNGASLKTKDGNINLTANITGGTTGNYSGVRVDSGAVVNALNGNVTVIGKGGTSGSGTNVGVYLNSVASEISTTNGILNVTGVGGGASGSLFNNLGVYVSNGGVISGGSTGVSTVTGTGGTTTSSSSSGHDGVGVSGGLSKITTSGGSLVVTGTGGGQQGVNVVGGGVIEATGSGNVTVNGTAGNAATSNKAGVAVNGSGSRIQTAGGNIVIDGRGGGSGSTINNHGVVVTTAGQVVAGGMGNITITGRGDYLNSTTGNFNVGVYIFDSLTRVTTAGGNISITGTGGGLNTSGTNDGVNMQTGAEVAAGGSGSVTVDGTGATISNSGFNHGVQLVNGARITSAGGPVLVRGNAGSGLFNAASVGVYLRSTAQITAGSLGTVTVEGRGSTAASSAADENTGVFLSSGRINSSGGDITVRGWGGGAGSTSGWNFGVNVASAGQISVPAGSGNVTVEGIGGAGTEARNYGVQVSGSSSIISAVTGTVTVTGTAGASPFALLNHGISVTSAGTISSTGDVLLVGNGGVGSTSYGIEIATSAARVNSVSGILRLTGTTTPGPTSYGIFVGSSGFIGSSTTTATIELIADSMSLGGSPSVQVSGSRTVTLLPKTPGFGINLGSADVAGTSLGLSSGELDSITAGTVQIGNASSGDITFTGVISKSAAGNLSLTPGLNRNFSLANYSATVPTSSNITVTLTGTGAMTSSVGGVKLTGGTVAITAEQGSIGSLLVPIGLNATTFTASTLGSFYFTSTNPSTSTIGAAGLSAGGVGYLGSGTYGLGGAERISDTTRFELGGSAILYLNNFNETFYSLTGSNSSHIRNGGPSLVTVTILAPTGTYNLLSTLGGSTTNERNFHIVKLGDSTLVLGGNNSFVGDLTIVSGLLITAHPNALGGTANQTYVGISSDYQASLDLNGMTIPAERLSLLGPAFGSNPKLFNSNPSIPASASGEIFLGDSSVTIGGAGSLTLSGKVTDSTWQFGFTKIGPNVLTLSGVSDFEETVIVIAGDLRVNGTIVGDAVVESGATISGIGTVNDILEVKDGGTISPGSEGAGTLTTKQTYIRAGAKVDVQFASAANYDSLAPFLPLFALGTTPAGPYPTLNLTSLGGYFPTTGGKFPLIKSTQNGAPLTGRLVSGAGSSQPVGTVLNEGTLVSDNIFGSGFGATLTYAGGTGNDDIVLNIAATTVKLISGDLVITDASAVGQVDNLTIVRNGADLVISDFNNPLAALPGFTQLTVQSISIPFASITGNLQINTAAGLDTLTVDFSEGDPIPAGGLAFTGGTPTTANSDTLIVTGSNLGAVSIVQSTASNGSITVGSFGTLTFTGVETIRQTGTATDLSLTPPPPAPVANALVLEDDGSVGNGLLRLTATTMSPMYFANPTGTLTINRGGVDDVISVGTTTVTSLSDLASNLVVGSSTAALSVVNIPAGRTLPTGDSFTAFATNAINFSNANSDWTTSGTGSLSFTSTRKITFVSGSTLTVANGDLTLSANQQAVASTDDFKGIDVNGAVISSTGTGNVTVLAT